ncbi:MAG: hypothetical protein A2Y14_00990 [Verrucomicrobia bacterium GWF2_51_19]|nr:MAG: hypothetical protein A2Y14_00990 [Verrucomicrobia bacterium GWF2_51_19]HCJ12059.1 flagellar basal body protein FliL [Opitutae bacterium]
MAEETQIEEVKEPGEGSAKGDGDGTATNVADKRGGMIGNPWLPVIVVIIALPLLSFVVSEFVLIPRVKKAVNAVNKEPAVAEGKTNEKTEQGKEGEKKGPKVAYSYAFNNIVGNLNGSLQSRYLKISFTAEGTSPKFTSVMENSHVKIVDSTLGLISSLTVEDLEKPGFKNILRNEMLTLFETALGEKIIEQIYFSEFVVQ